MIIRLENVNYIYNPGTAEEVTAVSDVNLELGGDSFTAIIGSTGSGKSTLIQMLNGLLEPSSGSITYDGVPIYKEGKLTKEEKKALREFMHSVNLCTTLDELGLGDLTDDELRVIAKEAADVPPMKNMPLDISAEDIYRAILAADAAK